MAGLLDDELDAFFGNPNLKRQTAKGRASAAKRDVNTLPDPRTYAAMQGLLGARPDEMGFSVLHPEYQQIMDVANPAYGLGLAAQLAPVLAPFTKGLPVGASVKNVGLGTDILQDTATNTASSMAQFKGFKNTSAFGKAKEVAKYLDSLDIPYTLNKSKTTNSAYLEVQTGKGDFDYPMQFRFSDHSTDLPHQNRQIFTNPKPDPNFDLDVFNGGGHDTEFAINKINELRRLSKLFSP